MAEQTPADGVREPSPLLRRGMLGGLLGYHLRRAQVALFRHFDQSVGVAEGITPGLLGTLALIAENPGLSQSRLAEAMEVDRSTMVAVIDQLEARGLAVRGRSPTDRRTHCLELTAKGRAAMRRIERLAREHEQAFAAHLSAGERAELVRLTTKLYAGRDQR